MVSNNLEDYEVLSILGAGLHSTCYKVRSKKSSEIFVWKAITYETLSESEKESVLAQIEQQTLANHPHLLRVHGYILHEKTNILYLVSEFCAHGNLSSLIQKCVLENEHLNENFLWQTLYQVACALKIGDRGLSFNLNDVFVDADYKIKLLSWELLSLVKGGPKSSSACFGRLIYELCTLQSGIRFEDGNPAATTKEILAQIPSYYSNELKEIVKFGLTTNFDFRTMIDAILCHPTILLKSSQAKPAKVFIKNRCVAKKEQPNHSILAENTRNTQIESSYRSKLDNIKNRETALKVREESYAFKAHELHKREKKVALAERLVKEKIVHAELYLKRCRENKSTTTGSTRSSNSKPTSYENIDTSFSADCGDSSIIATSNKMNQQAIKKPPAFFRTLSDRRVRFKGHSPLKNMRNRIFPTLPSHNSQPNLNQAEMSSTSTSDKSEGGNIKDKPDGGVGKKSRKKLDLFSVLPIKGRKPLVDLNVQNAVIHEETDNGTDLQYEYTRPISWTEESKQHAFNLLRIMNQEGENVPVKHTYL